MNYALVEFRYKNLLVIIDPEHNEHFTSNIIGDVQAGKRNLE